MHTKEYNTKKVDAKPRVLKVEGLLLGYITLLKYQHLWWIQETSNGLLDRKPLIIVKKKKSDQ